MTSIGELQRIDVKEGEGNQTVVVTIEGEDGSFSFNVSDADKTGMLMKLSGRVFRLLQGPFRNI